MRDWGGLHRLAKMIEVGAEEEPLSRNVSRLRRQRQYGSRTEPSSTGSVARVAAVKKSVMTMFGLFGSGRNM